MFNYTSVAQMKLQTLKIGQTVTTQGYTTPNDGGGAQYLIVAGGTGTDDGGSYIDLAGGQQAELMHHGIVNIGQFGAREGDLSSDISPIMTAMRANTSISEIKFNGADYYLLSDYSYNSSAGTKVRISYTGIEGKTAIRLRNGVEFEITKSNQEALIVQGIEFYNDDANNANAIKMVGAKQTVRDCGFYDFDVGLFVSTFYQLIQNNLFTGGRVGIQDLTTAGYSTNELLGNFFTGQSEGGINLTSLTAARSNNRIAGNKFEVIAAGGYAIKLRGSNDSHIDTPYMESIGGATGNGIDLEDCENIQITTPRSTPPDDTLKAVRSSVTFSGGGTITGIDATDNSTVLMYGPYETIAGIVYATDNTSFIKSYDNEKNLTGMFLTPGLSRIAPGVSIIRNGAGDYSVTYDTARETNRTCVLVTAHTSSSGNTRHAYVYGSGPTGFGINVENLAGTLTDPESISYLVQELNSTQI